MAFIKAACNVPSHTAHHVDSHKEAMALALEHVYHAHNHNHYFIGPTCFKAHLLTYFHSKSKSASYILSHFGPFGSYTSLIKWLTEQGKTPSPTLCNDIITYYDNNQVISKPIMSKLTTLSNYPQSPLLSI